MTKHINLQKNYSLNQGGYQLKLPLNIEIIILEDDSEYWKIENIRTKTLQIAKTSCGKTDECRSGSWNQDNSGSF